MLLIGGGLMVIVILGVAALLSGDEDSKDTRPSAPSTQATVDSTSEAPRRSRQEVRLARLDRAKSRSTVTNAYESLDVVARSWFTRLDANVTAGLLTAEKDPNVLRFCDAMSRAAQREAIDYARTTSSVAGVKWSCPSAIALLIRRSNQQGRAARTLKARVVGVNVEGNRGTATMDFGRGPQSSIPLVRERGAWKIAAAPIGG